MIPQWILHFDGLCEPRNPGGVMAWGWVLRIPGRTPLTGFGSKAATPENTNNVAEYAALYFGLVTAKAERDRLHDGERWPGLIVHGDSKLVCQQIADLWNVNQPRLQRAHAACLEVLNGMKAWGIEWVPREENTEADELSRRGYFNSTGKNPPERHRKSA